MKSHNKKDDEAKASHEPSIEELLVGDLVQAANPYGCNQYGEGWAGEHNGKRSTPGKPEKKGDSKKEEETKKAEEQKNKETDEDEFSDWPTHGKNFSDWKSEMEDAVNNAVERTKYLGYGQGVYFDGYEFSTNDKDGRAIELLAPDDIEENIKEWERDYDDNMNDAISDFVEFGGKEIFNQIDWDDLKETLKYYKKKKASAYK